MQPFEWIDATSVEQAASLLAETRPDRPVRAKGAGLDLLDLMKEGIVAPARVVNLKTIPGLDRIEKTGDGLSIGALVTLHQLDTNPQIRGLYVALADAAGHAATPQVRHAATIGGNLLQKTRCWYYRREHFHHLDGDARDWIARGQNQLHAIFDNARSAMVQASTPATALIAYGASVELVNSAGEKRTAELEQFYLPPEMSRPVDAKIEPNEVLTRVLIPSLPPAMKSAYHKQTERDSYDWPICDVAVSLQMDGQTLRSARIVMGWVAPTPRRAVDAEHLLAGKQINETVARQAAAAAVAGATPLSKNQFKVPILETVVRRTLLKAVEA